MSIILSLKKFVKKNSRGIIIGGIVGYFFSKIYFPVESVSSGRAELLSRAVSPGILDGLLPSSASLQVYTKITLFMVLSLAFFGMIAQQLLEGKK